MDISDDFRGMVQNLEKILHDEESAVSNLKTERQCAQSNYDSLVDQMGFREKYLGGWFWGNKALVRQADSIEATLKRYDQDIDCAKRKAESTDDDINHKIVSYLKDSDKEYHTLQKAYGQISKVKDTTDSYMRKIKSALSAIDSAQTTETMDMFTDNKGISVLSSMQNSAAKSAINEVKHATEHFRDVMNEYETCAHEYHVDANVDSGGISDMGDLFMDLAFDGGFDFMSIFTLSALDRAEDQMRELKGQVSGIQHRIESKYNDLQERHDQYLRNVRQICNTWND